MADKVQLIKEEIESYKESMKGLEPHSDFRRGQITAYNHIIQFIDSLPEEHNEDLDEEISNYIKDNFFGSGSMGFFSNRTKQELNSIDVANIANHFAEWQKQKDQQTIEPAEDHAMLAGMNKMKEEMLKEAVELHIIESFNPVGTENEKPHGFTALCYNCKYPDFYPITGQTIKIIQIK